MPFPSQNPTYAMPAFAPQQVSGTWNAVPVKQQPRMPVSAAMAGGKTNLNPAPRPTIRLQAPETPRTPPAPLVLPSPEALGIGRSNSAPAAAPPLDWNLAHARLKRLGALGFHLDNVPQGGVRATFLLPAGNQRPHQIEVVADTEAAAVQAALDNAESWALARK